MSHGTVSNHRAIRPKFSESTDTDAIRHFSGSSQWRLGNEIIRPFDTFHPRGLTRRGDRIFLSAVEVMEPARDHFDPGVGRAHLFGTGFRGTLTGHIELGEGDIYHPGGIDFDGTWIWVPVAQYRPDSRSIVFRVDPSSLEKYELPRTQNHIGAVMRRRAGRRLHGFSWASPYR